MNSKSSMRKESTPSEGPCSLCVLDRYSTLKDFQNASNENYNFWNPEQFKSSLTS